MNFEKSQNIPKRLRTSEHLVEEAWHFANSLARGRWNNRDISEVETTNRVVDSIGESFDLGEYYGEPVYSQMILSFSALKAYVDTDIGYAMAPTYIIKSETSQDISKDEIPATVLEEILEEAEDEDHPLHEALDESDLQTTDLFLDTLEDFEIMRSQEVVYNISYDGTIQDYSHRYIYRINGNEVHEVLYSLSTSQDEWSPVQLADGTVAENRPSILPLLSKRSVKSEAADVDASFKEFLFNNDFHELMRSGEVSKQEHIHRALSILGLISSGYIDLRNR